LFHVVLKEYFFFVKHQNTILSAHHAHDNHRYAADESALIARRAENMRRYPPVAQTNDGG